MAFEDRTLHSYVGGWPEYVRAREERKARPPEVATAKPAKSGAAKPGAVKSRAAKSGAAKLGGGELEGGESARPAKPKPKRPASPRAQEQLEREIEAAEAQLRAVEDELSEPAAWSTPKMSADSTARHEAAKRAVEQLYERWEAIAG